jgi:hypothetical protein
MYKCMFSLLAVLLPLMATGAYAQKQDTIYVFCSVMSVTSTDVYYSTIFSSDYGLSVDRYAPQFQKWLLQTNSSLRDQDLRSTCFPGRSLDAIKNDRAYQIDHDKTNSRHPIETRWPDSQ